jgi:hypothetical protein
VSDTGRKAASRHGAALRGRGVTLPAQCLTPPLSVSAVAS